MVVSDTFMTVMLGSSGRVIPSVVAPDKLRVTL